LGLAEVVSAIELVNIGDVDSVDNVEVVIEIPWVIIEKMF
jgi:hypothetical protein